MRDPKLITIADDGLITFGWTGEDATGFDLLLQQLCLAVLSKTREFQFGHFPGGDVETLATFNVSKNDTSQLSAELTSRLTSIVKHLKQNHTDLTDATLDSVQYNPSTKGVIAGIRVKSVYGIRYIRVNLKS